MNLKTITDIQTEYESNKCTIDDLRLQNFCKEIRNSPDDFFIVKYRGEIEVTRKKTDSQHDGTPTLNSFTFNIFHQIYTDLELYIRYQNRSKQEKSWINKFLSIFKK